MVCLDTSFLVDLLRGNQEAMAYLSQLQQTSEAVTVAAPTIFELVEAAELLRSPKEKLAIKQLLSSMTVLPLDNDAAWKAGELSASLVRGGQSIGHIDTLIGAIASTHNEMLITRNVKHFSRISGLKVEKY